MGVVCSQGPSQSEANMGPSHSGGPFVPLHSKAFHTPPVHDEIGTHKQDMGQDTETEEVERTQPGPHCGR